jgi:hypothetical protein
MVTSGISLQDALNGLMNNESTDEYVTRIWSTCPRMLTIIGSKGIDEDNLSYIIDDSTTHLPMTSVLERVQDSSKQVLKVSIPEQKGGGASFYFGDLYTHFLIEGHAHTTHYVNMSEEFTVYKDFNTELAAVSSRCKNSVNETKIIVLVELDSTEKKKGISNQNVTLAISSSEQSTSVTEKRKYSRDILIKKLLERLLKDGIDIVVFLTNPYMTFASNLFKEVIPSDKKVSQSIAERIRNAM